MPRFFKHSEQCLVSMREGNTAGVVNDQTEENCNKSPTSNLKTSDCICAYKILAGAVAICYTAVINYTLK